MPGSAQEKKSYKSTLNLPRTAFPMKANLVQNEPATLALWQKEDLYGQIRRARAQGQGYVFHDGPPYANGSIHLGHLLNKVLKDIVVRSKTMAGYDCPYVPGWDCHGLPIEHKVIQELAGAARDMSPIEVRRRCGAYAKRFVKLQSRQMQRLLTLGDYSRPYLTMDRAYEAAVLEVFADLVSKGLVYRALKPVHWSIANQTALADAELEYDDREDTSVYVGFEAQDLVQLVRAFGLSEGDLSGRRPRFLIWTTTPWTLPANMAIAVNEGFSYCLVDMGSQTFVIASDLVEAVAGVVGAQPNRIADRPGVALKGLRYRHPFIDRVGCVVGADYVTLDDGTGLVHTAPGHGNEDYHTGLLYGLRFAPSDGGGQVVCTGEDAGGAGQPDVYSPVRADGTFDDTVPQWLRGVDVWTANTSIIQRLRESGHLYHDQTFTHSYPHDWRSKTPVIFRATQQWFVSMDRPAQHCLRDAALDATDRDVCFHPPSGRNRMRGMLESRPDWCLSRQRAWGLPIPAFYGARHDQVLLTAASVRAVAAVIHQHGSDHWFQATPAQLLARYDPSNDPDAPDWLDRSSLVCEASGLTKSQDIFDVWFESGSSWNAVLRERGLGYPADLYLEGSDQHRGWFQLSLLPALGVTGQSPFRSVLTHGFMVDKDGRKMSKSGGNALEVETLLKDFGADVCRWWVGSLNTEHDIKVDPEFFRLAGEEYRKVRNTIRYLLSNLGDFDMARDRYTLTADDANSLDAWALDQLNRLIDVVRRGYGEFQFRRVHEALFHFCNQTMSAVYLAATKDRLYCDRPDHPRRRRTQTAIHAITDALVRLIAPILPHTSGEAWRALQGKEAGSIHLQLFPEPLLGLMVDSDWDAVMRFRDDALKHIERARASRGIDNPLDCGLRVGIQRSARDGGQLLGRFDTTDLADLCGVSRVELVEAGQAPTSGVQIEVMDLREQPRCERCWKRDPTVKQRRDGGMLSDRDTEALGLA